jgi:hypothetical protein
MVEPRICVDQSICFVIYIRHSLFTFRAWAVLGGRVGFGNRFLLRAEFESQYRLLRFRALVNQRLVRESCSCQGWLG